MVRTRDSGARKAVAAKAPRKVLASSGGGGAAGLGSPSGKVGKYAGGNGYCPRPTPDWQKGIGAFIVRKPAAEKENSEPVEEDTMETVPAAASTTATEGSSSSSSQQTSSEVADSSSQGSSSSEPACSTNSQPEPSSPVKKNGLISDSDEDE